jgi:hypothetical protein
MKIRMMGCVIVIALMLPVTAEAKCESGDLRGRWDVYGFLDSALDLEGTLKCVFILNRSGRFSDAVCVGRSSDGRGGSVNCGRLTVRATLP